MMKLFRICLKSLIIPFLIIKLQIIFSSFLLYFLMVITFHFTVTKQNHDQFHARLSRNHINFHIFKAQKCWTTEEKSDGTPPHGFLEDDLYANSEITCPRQYGGCVTQICRKSRFTMREQMQIQQYTKL